MINRIFFEVKGDYDELSFDREPGSTICRLEHVRLGEEGAQDGET